MSLMEVNLQFLMQPFCLCRNPNRPYTVNHLFGRKAKSMVHNDYKNGNGASSSSSRDSRRRSNKNDQFDNIQTNLAKWEEYDGKTQKYLAIGKILYINIHAHAST